MRRIWGAIAFTMAIGIVALSLVPRALGALPDVELPAVDEPTPAPPPTSTRVPLVAELHSDWYTQSRAPVLTVGQTADLTVQYRNVGLTDWIKGSPSELRLGEIGDRPLPPEMRVNWPYWDRPAIQTEAVVHPQQIATFTFTVAGAAAGVFRLKLRPVVDGVAGSRIRASTSTSGSPESDARRERRPLRGAP